MPISTKLHLIDKKSLVYFAILFVSITIAITLFHTYLLQFILLLFFVICLLPFAIQVYRNKVNVFLPYVFFSLVVLIYTFSVPVDYLIFENSLDNELEDIVNVLLLYIVLLGSFFAGYFVWPANDENESSCAKASLDYLPSYYPYVLIFVGVLLYLVLMHIAAGSILNFMQSTRQQRVLLVEGKGYLKFGNYLIQAGWIILFARSLSKAGELKSLVHFRKTTFINLVYFFLYASFFFYLGDRKQIVILAICLFCVYSFYKKINYSRLSLFVIIIVPLLHIFSRLRNLTSRPLDFIAGFYQTFRLEYFNFSHGELGAQFLVAQKLTKELNFLDFRYGMTYLEALIILIPRFLIADRPLTPALSYVKDYMPEYYETGGTVAFSLLGEAFQNFGYLGPIIIGLLLGTLCRFVYMSLIEKQKSLYSIVTYSVFLSILFFSMRADFATLVKLSFMSIILPITLPVLAFRYFNISQSDNSDLSQNGSA